MTNKKINSEEILSVEQLDEVAGGTYLESADDAKRFDELGIKVFDKDISGVPVLTHNEFEKLRATFNQFGVEVKDRGGLINNNEYFIGGTKVTRDVAWAHIESQFKK